VGEVAFVPTTEIGSIRSPRQRAIASRWRRLHRAPYQIDDQFKLGGLNYRKIGGLLALKNATGVDTGLVICLPQR